MADKVEVDKGRKSESSRKSRSRQREDQSEERHLRKGHGQTHSRSHGRTRSRSQPVSASASGDPPTVNVFATLARALIQDLLNPPDDSRCVGHWGWGVFHSAAGSRSPEDLKRMAEEPVKCQPAFLATVHGCSLLTQVRHGNTTVFADSTTD